MRTKVQKWGNSLGLRIPKAFAEEAAVKAGSTVDLTVSDGELVVRAVAKTYKLQELLEGISKHNLHSEVPTGERQGREIW